MIMALFCAISCVIFDVYRTKKQGSVSGCGGGGDSPLPFISNFPNPETASGFWGRYITEIVLEFEQKRAVIVQKVVRILCLMDEVVQIRRIRTRYRA